MCQWMVVKTLISLVILMLSGLTCQMKCFPKLLDIFHISICKRLIEDIWKVEAFKTTTTTKNLEGEWTNPLSITLKVEKSYFLTVT